MVFYGKTVKTNVIFLCMYSVCWGEKGSSSNRAKVKTLVQSSGSYIVTCEITH